MIRNYEEILIEAEGKPSHVLCAAEMCCVPQLGPRESPGFISGSSLKAGYTDMHLSFQILRGLRQEDREVEVGLGNITRPFLKYRQASSTHLYP